MQRLYFGHPINTYGTAFEDELLSRIRASFPDWEIENPNQPRHQEGYVEWKRTHGSGMRYYYERVLPDCHGGIFLPFRDGAWGAGVHGEAKFLSQADKPVWLISPHGFIEPVRDVGAVYALTVEETRRRIRTPDGSALLPY